MKSQRLLFICSQNRLRSPTAEQVFASMPNIETASAGINHDAEVPVTPELIDWADIIFVMERDQQRKLSTKFREPLNRKRVICLDIPDEYEYMDPVLVSLLRERVSAFLLEP